LLKQDFFYKPTECQGAEGARYSNLNSGI